MCVTTIIGSRSIPESIPAFCKRARIRHSRDWEIRIRDLLEFQSLITAFSHLPARQETSSERMAERNRDKEIS